VSRRAAQRSRYLNTPRDSLLHCLTMRTRTAHLGALHLRNNGDTAREGGCKTPLCSLYIRQLMRSREKQDMSLDKEGATRIGNVSLSVGAAARLYNLPAGVSQGISVSCGMGPTSLPCHLPSYTARSAVTRLARHARIAARDRRLSDDTP